MRRTDTTLAVILAGLSGFAPIGASAQVPATPPQINPGAIGNQGQQNRQQMEQQNALPSVPSVIQPAPPAPSAEEDKGPTFTLKEIDVDETRFLSRDEIERITAPYIGQTVGIGTLKKIVGALNALLAEGRNVNAAAYLPPQKIHNGVVRIAILEGRLGAIKVSGAEEMSDWFVRSHVDIEPNEVVDLPQVARDLARFNETGVARIQALVQPGAQFGLTDIELSVTEPPVNLLQTFVDNQGVSSVGKHEAGVMYQRYAPLGIDDRLTLYSVKATGNVSGNVGYNVPINSWGGRAGISASSGAIKVISGPYQSLRVIGSSDSYAANLSQPLYADAQWVFLVNGSLSYNISRSSQLSTMVTWDDATIKTVGYKLGYANEFLKASVSPTFSWVHSNSHISEETTSFNLTGGTFYLLGQMPEDFSLLLSGSWQNSWLEQIPGDQMFQVGGPTSVRGYDANATSGSSGYYANLELHHPLPLPDPLQFNGTYLDGFVFFDQGGVYNHYPKYTDLKSVGLGFSWNISQNFTAEFNAGFPVERSIHPQGVGDVYFRIIAKAF